jgi:NADH-quinone oxidoreductase subunit C
VVVRLSDAGTTGTTGAGAEDVQALPGDALREGIVDTVRRAIGDQLVAIHLVPQRELVLRVATPAWRVTAEALHAAGFDYFCFLSAIDWMPSPYGRGEDDPTQPPPERDTAIVQGVTGGDTRFQVFARVTDTSRHVGVTLKVDVPDEPFAVESWIPVYAGANWHERETHEMYGIGFLGHPDLRNLYLPTDFEGYPLRKDFPLLARMVKPWPGIVDVEPMPVDETDDAASEPAVAAEGSASDEADAARGSAADDEPAVEGGAE